MATQKPFLKWAGKKTSILDRLRAAVPAPTAGGRFLEPFVGSAAVLLGLGYRPVVAGDANGDLIGLFQAVQTDVEALIATAVPFFAATENTPTAFYEHRRAFNAAPPGLTRWARFLYLNRHAFNGLCRYNAAGAFNVPFGRYKQPVLPADEMRAFAAATTDVQFVQADFVTMMEGAGPGDVVYCDPPYLPLTTASSFTSYHTAGFDLADQQRLADAARAAAARGATVVISNHATDTARAIYAGATCTEFAVARSIGGTKARRTPAQELLAVFAPAP